MAVAEPIGGEWPERCRAAAARLGIARDDDDESSPGDLLDALKVYQAERAANYKQAEDLTSSGICALPSITSIWFLASRVNGTTNRSFSRDVPQLAAALALKVLTTANIRQRPPSTPGPRGRRGMRYPASEKLEIIRLVEQSHLPVRRTLATLGDPAWDVLPVV